MNKNDVKLIQALPDDCRWYVDDYIKKNDNVIVISAWGDTLQRSYAHSCNIFESECFDKLCAKADINISHTVQTAGFPEPDDKVVSPPAPMDAMLKKVPPSHNMTVDEYANELLSGFERACDCETVKPCTVFGQIVIAVEVLCRTFDIQGLKESVKLHTKWLLGDKPDSIPFDRFLKFSDVIFISKCKFDSLLDSLITKVIDKVFSQKCSHVIAKKIFHDRELSVVALFVCRYKLVLHSTESMVSKFPLHVEELCDEIKLMGTKNALKCLNDVKLIYQNRDVLNRFTGQKEKVDILDYSSNYLELFLSGLLKQYGEIRQAVSDPMCKMNIEDAEIFCNPVYRQIVILMDVRKNRRKIN